MPSKSKKKPECCQICDVPLMVPLRFPNGDMRFFLRYWIEFSDGHCDEPYCEHCQQRMLRGCPPYTPADQARAAFIDKVIAMNRDGG